jgi:hypothetical protein
MLCSPLHTPYTSGDSIIQGDASAYSNRRYTRKRTAAPETEVIPMFPVNIRFREKESEPTTAQYHQQTTPIGSVTEDKK